MPAEPSIMRSLHKRLGQVLEYVGSWGHDSLANYQKFPIVECVDDIALVTNTAHYLQLQLDLFHTYTTPPIPYLHD